MTGYNAKWNFCPFCGHRIYAHDANGCCYVIDIVRMGETKPQPQQCDCKVNVHYFQLVGHG